MGFCRPTCAIALWTQPLQVVDRRLHPVLLHQRFQPSLHRFTFLYFIGFRFHLPCFVCAAPRLAHGHAQARPVPARGLQGRELTAILLEYR
jgi:hypothetical protein